MTPLVVSRVFVTAGAAIHLTALLAIGAPSFWFACSVMVCMLWMANTHRGSERLQSVWLLLLTASLVAATFTALDARSSLAAFLCFLGAWDMGTLSMRSGEPDPSVPTLTRRHAQRLIGTLSLGLLVGITALSVRIELAFGWALLLVVLLVWGLTTVMREAGRSGS